LDIPVLSFAKIYDYASYVSDELIHEILCILLFVREDKQVLNLK